MARIYTVSFSEKITQNRMLKRFEHMVVDSIGSIVGKSVGCIGQRIRYLGPFEFENLVAQFVLGLRSSDIDH